MYNEAWKLSGGVLGQDDPCLAHFLEKRFGSAAYIEALAALLRKEETYEEEEETYEEETYEEEEETYEEEEETYDFPRTPRQHDPLGY